MTKQIPNKFAKVCACGANVPVGAGFSQLDKPKAEGGTWNTVCRGCAYPDHREAARPTPAPTADPPTEEHPPTEEQVASVEMFRKCVAEGRVGLAIQAGAGCLAAGTILHVNRAGKGFQFPIERVVRSMAGVDFFTRTLNGKPVTQRTPGWDQAIPTRLARADDGVVRLGPLGSCWASGTKLTYTLTTQEGRTIRATEEHPFLTAEGDWAKLGNLRPGDGVQVNTGRSARGRGAKRQYRTRFTKHHPYQILDSHDRRRFKVAEHRLVIEAEMNGMTLDQFLRVLNHEPALASTQAFLGPDQHVHHADLNPRNNALANLTLMTETEHHQHHAAEGDTRNVLWQVGVETIASIATFGEEPTFDVSMEDAPHNFIANGFVVHNTGKTTTLVLIGKSTDLLGSYMAFNRKIVESSATKMPPNIACRTIHKLAWEQVGRRHYGHKKGARMRSSEIARALKIDPLYWNFGEQRKVLQPGKLAGQVMLAVRNFCNSADEAPNADHFAYIDGIDMPTGDGKRTWDTNRAVRKHLASALTAAWADLVAVDGQLPFTPDCFLKIWQLGIHGPAKIPGAFIMVDESQDVSPVMMAVALAQGKPIVWVGDSQQEIYGWRGSINAMDNVPSDATTYLTNSFRFGPAIAEVANTILDTIPEAEIRLTGQGAPSTTRHGIDPDAILTRSNAGAIDVVLAMIAAGRKPFLVGGGGEVKRFALAAKDLMEGRDTDHPDLACFDSWGQVEEYVANDVLGSDLELMVKLIEKHGVDVVLQAVGNEVREQDADVVVSTAHKSKGLEWDNVQLWNDFSAERTDASERRLLYVACTRARRNLDFGYCAPVVELMGGEAHTPPTAAQIENTGTAALPTAPAASQEPVPSQGVVSVQVAPPVATVPVFPSESVDRWQRSGPPPPPEPKTFIGRCVPGCKHAVKVTGIMVVQHRKFRGIYDAHGDRIPIPSCPEHGRRPWLKELEVGDGTGVRCNASCWNATR